MEEKRIRTLERVFKGVSNHYRIEILLLIEKSPGITLEQIVTRLRANYFTIGEHVNRLKNAGLINKKYKGKFVVHSLSPYGEKAVKTLNNFIE